jgi:hypothetical protein
VRYKSLLPTAIFVDNFAVSARSAFKETGSNNIMISVTGCQVFLLDNVALGMIVLHHHMSFATNVAAAISICTCFVVAYWRRPCCTSRLMILCAGFVTL